MPGVRYDHPNVIVRREAQFLTVAGSGTVGGKFAVFQAARLKAVHAVVVTAGTSASPGHALTVKIGTTSIGLLALATNTAGSIVSSAVLDQDVAPGQILTVTNGTDVTGVAHVIYEYHVRQDSVFS